jgi:hypothetical protein
MRTELDKLMEGNVELRHDRDADRVRMRELKADRDADRIRMKADRDADRGHIKELAAKIDELKELDDGLRTQQKRLCEREIFTAIYAALGYKSKISHTRFFAKLGENLNTINAVVDGEIGGNQNIEQILEVLDPSPGNSIFRLGNRSAHHYTIKDASRLATHPSIRTLLPLLSAGMSEEVGLQDAGSAAWRRLSRLYPGLSLIDK